MNKKLIIIGLSLFLAIAAFFVLFRVLAKPVTPGILSGIQKDERALLLEKARKLMTAGDDDAAIKDLEILAVKYPDSSEAETGLTEAASIYEKRSDLLRARDTYQKAIERFPNSNNILKMQEALDNINIKILFSPIITPDSFMYEVQKGDTLAKLAKRYNTTIDLITKANNIKDSTIKFGKKIKITRSKFGIVVDKSQNILTLKADGNILKTYRVSTGKNYSTPVGTFKITTKIMNPTWYTAGAVVPPDSPNNILGSRWLGISREGYGIHGTTEPESIGKHATAGCVRMKNSEVEELYTIVPEGTEVVIVD